MNDYYKINSLLDDIENLLDGILLSGISICRDGTLKEINNMSVESNNIGLKQGSSLLGKLEKSYLAKDHNIHFNDSEIVECCAVLGTYVDTIKSKMKINMVEENLR